MTQVLIKMVIDKQTPYGGINISLEAIASVVGSAVIECYGVVALATKDTLRENIQLLLKQETYSKGVSVKKGKLGYEISVYIIVATGVKITEVIVEVQKKIKYVLSKTFDLKFTAINVYVQGIKEPA